MSTNFFKKRFSWILYIATAFFILSTLIYAFSFSTMKSTFIGKSFYFLAVEGGNVEVGTEFAKLDGGAGYVITANGKEYAALSVYFKEEDSQSVQAGLLQDGQKTIVIRKAVNELYFKGNKKKKAGLYLSALHTFESYLSLLSDCISRLEKGITQERCKGILEILQRQFHHVEAHYAAYPAFAEVCHSSSQALEDISKKTIFLKDLRYLLCWQAEQYLELCATFSIIKK